MLLRANLWRSVLIFVLFAGVLAVSAVFGDAAKVRAFVLAMPFAAPLWGPLAFVLVCGFLAVFALPRQLISFTAGALYGAGQGAVWAIAAAVLGCVCSFFLARSVLRTPFALWCSKKWPAHMAQCNRLLAASPLLAALGLRLLPLGLNAGISLIGGLSSVPWRPFVLGSALGYVPQCVAFALLGSGLQVRPVWSFVLSALLFVVALALAAFVYRRMARLAEPGAL